MKIIRGLARLDGHAKAGSNVEIIDGDGEVITTAKAGADGKWSVESLELPTGQHTIHAVASGKKSAAIEVEIAADDSEPEPELCDRAESLYVKIVEARAQGFNIDVDLGLEVLAMTSRTMDDFNADVAELGYLLADERFATAYFTLD